MVIPVFALFAVGFCSCKARQAAKVDPFLNHPKVSQSESGKTSQSEDLSRSANGDALRDLNAQPQKPGRVKLGSNTESLPRQTIPARDGNPPVKSPFQDGQTVDPVSFHPADDLQSQSYLNADATNPFANRPTDSATTFTPFEPRVPPANVGHQETAQPETVADEKTWSEEYLYDGGDRDLPVHYDSFNRLGLDTEDTVAEYSDDGGKQHVKATNRVSIYAPRFGAVRSISQPSTDVAVDKLAGTMESKRISGMQNRTVPSDHVQRESLDGVHVRSRVSGVETEARSTGVEQRTSVAEHTKLNNVYEDLAFLRSGQLIDSEEARLNYGIQAAIIWSEARSPVITAGTTTGQEISATSQMQEMIGLEDERRTKGDLRIVKLADKKLAHPGDVITFTIRYDNVGQRELRNLQIVDNLTPRLEYVEDSATSDRAGRLVVEDNQEGSLVLRFEVSDPLPGRQGGVVTFKARVR